MLKFEALYRGGMLVPSGPLPVSEGETIQFEILERPQTAVQPVAQPVTLLPGERDYNDNDDERPWRGIFVLEHKPDPSKIIASSSWPMPPIESIPRAKPIINMAWHRIHDDDDET